MFGGFNVNKLKPQLKMAVGRIQMASNKKAALSKQTMREIALLLNEDPPREEKAKIRCEALIRDDDLIEAYEILQLQCELLYERIKLIEHSKSCPPDLQSVVATVMWAAHRVDIPELLVIRQQLRAKYGKTFEDACINNVGGILNERVVHKLSVEPPVAYLVQTYLVRICEREQVNWRPSVHLTAAQLAEPMAAPVGYSVGVGQGTGLGPATMAEAFGGDAKMVDPDALPPALPAAKVYVPPHSAGTATTNEECDIVIPPGSVVDASSSSSCNNATDGHNSTGANGNNGRSDSSYEDLAARFNQLKK